MACLDRAWPVFVSMMYARYDVGKVRERKVCVRRVV